jgi:drug/metabolite transporter (DMT)-like permease
MTNDPRATDPAPSLSSYLWLATVPLIWGSHFVFLKIVYTEYDVMGMLSLRYALMILALWAVLWFSERDLRFPLRQVPYLIGFSLLMVTVYQVLFALAIKWASAGESALLISTAPIFAALTAAILRWEHLTRRTAVGIALGFAGIFAVIYGGQGLAHLPPTHVKGCWVMLAAAIMWAWYAVLARPLLAQNSPLKVTAYCHTVGGIPLIALGLPEVMRVTPGLIARMSDPSAVANVLWVFFGIVFYAWFSGAYAFTLWYRAVQRLGAGRTMMFQYCVPVVGLAAAIVVRSEWPGALQWVGVGLTLAGVFIAARRPVANGRRKNGTEEADCSDAA